MEKLRQYWPAIVIVGFGSAVVAIVAGLGGGTASIAWTGGIIGVLAGVALASVNARKAKDDAETPDSSGEAKRRG